VSERFERFCETVDECSQVAKSVDSVDSMFWFARSLSAELHFKPSALHQPVAFIPTFSLGRFFVSFVYKHLSSFRPGESNDP